MEIETSLDPSSLSSTDCLDLPIDHCVIDKRTELDLESDASEQISPTEYLGKALVISVAFSANSGGIVTLFGTPVNPILTTMADE